MMTDLLQVLVVDDEPIARDILETYTSKMPGLHLAGTAANALEAFLVLNQKPIDIMLLDINMPEISGIDFLKTLKNPPKVIFTTAYSEFALVSYDLDAVDYLLKPVSFERFFKAMQKAIARVHEHTLLSVPTQGAPPQADRLMFVKSGGKLIKLGIPDIWFIEGLRDYVTICTAQGKTIVHSTMKNMEQHLAAHANFVRIHKSWIVNLNFIEEVDGNTIRIKGQSLVIGTTYRDGVFNLLNQLKFL